ncbi:DEAD/DEAH box helicase [Effusibacillus dendaii]|uniref:ATP-dependent RNA helicase CshA n=1 Tax=Effusibacillus dendaii TaxID=2743772 RepID=A0A7I8DI30_9BACL|nr:DEAD/DEAH box helicase [Effusibacillus dendaii]BCJ87501.1 DEAD-box ATP-dependent RNA helicase CshA [Effusibacillus dendaii]
MRFEDLHISEPVLRALSEAGFESATAIQAEAIPIAFAGRDMIGQAQTGSGKTVAFSIPMVEKVDTEHDTVQGLIITPTRELCIQVAEEIRKVGSYKGVRTLPVYGGQDIERQIKALKNRPHVIIATPGRLIDHLNRRTVRLRDVSMVVLDEADEMLDMGFIEDIEKILEQCPVDRQTLLFSATMKGAVKELAKKFMKDIKTVSVKAQEVTVPSIEQVYYEVPESKKLDALTRLLDIQNPELAIVFGRTKRRVDELMNALITRGYQADGLHGDLSQRQRDTVMRKFRDGAVEILVATDVAARGLDVSGVTHVYNFDIPQDVDSYVHRIGRTGRAGKSGIASTFVTPREIDHLHLIEKVTKRKIEKRPLPTIAEARIGKQRLAMEQLQNTISSEDLGGYKSLAEEMLEQHDSIQIVSAALKILTKETNEAPVKLTAERPVLRKRAKETGGGRQQRRGSGTHKKPYGATARTGSKQKSGKKNTVYAR